MIRKSLLFILIFLVFNFSLFANPMNCQDFLNYEYENFRTECYILSNGIQIHTYHFNIDLEGMRLSSLVFPIIQEKLKQYILIKIIEKNKSKEYRKLIYDNATVEMSMDEKYTHQFGKITKQVFVITWSK